MQKKESKKDKQGKIKQKGGINKRGTADEKTNKEIFKFNFQNKEDSKLNRKKKKTDTPTIQKKKKLKVF